MSRRGRFSIWKDDPTLDSWYNTAVDRNFIPRNSNGNPVEEMLFFGIAKPNQVNYPSGEWLYDAGMGHLESKFHLQMSLVIYLTLLSTCSFTNVEYSRIDPTWPHIQQTHHRQTSASSSRFSDSLCFEGQCYLLLRLHICQCWWSRRGQTWQAQPR
jgi:hypothetical protein